MNSTVKSLLSLVALLFITSPIQAEEAPWGRGEAQEKDYPPQKVVYDVAATSREHFTGVVDRVSYLNNIYEADPFGTHIVMVLHGGEIPFFAIENYDKNKELMTRVQSLTVGGTITVRMCEQAAKAHGYEPDEIHGFVEVVPMADAEIVHLQRELGYAYMR